MLDRHIIEWSLTEKAFKAKSYVEIFNMLLENYRAIYGQDIDLTVETPFGEELRMKAQMLYDMAKLAEDIYYTIDANNAKGAILDNVVAFTSNLVRKTNIQTVLTAELKFVGDDITNLSIINFAYVQDDYGILWRIDPFTAGVTILEGGTDLSTAPANLVKLTAANYGENLLDGSVTQLLVNGSFRTNSVSVSNIIYVQIGSIAESDEQLRLRKNNTLNYNSVYLLDSIRDHILKNIYSVKDVMIYNANGRATSSTVIDTDQNSLLPLILNDGTVEEITVMRHDLLVLIQPQIGLTLTSFTDGTTVTALSEAIAQVLKLKITPGIATSYELKTRDELNAIVPVTNQTGYISVDLLQTYGSSTYTERYSFYVVNQYSPALYISLVKKSNYDPVNTPIRIREAIYKLSEKYTINRDLDISEIMTAVMSANLDLMNPTFVPSLVSVGGGTADELKVNNGYWLVDKTAESAVGTADWNIIII